MIAKRRKPPTEQWRIRFPQIESVPTLLDLPEELCDSSRSIQDLDDILAEVRLVFDCELPFRILECLSDTSCACQTIGDEQGYKFVAELFLNVLPHISGRFGCEWEIGSSRKDTGYKSSAVVRRRSYRTHCGKPSFIMRADGNLHAPRFLQVAAKSIRNTGKSVD